MTPEEAIKTIRGAWSLMCQTNIRFDFVVDYREAAEMAIEALKEVQQYREIGTVEECQEAVEKRTPKKPIPINHKEYTNKIENAEFLEDSYFCPNCGTVIRSGSCCSRCGQKLNWNENFEGMEDERD